MSYARSAQYYDYFDTKGNLEFYRSLAQETSGDVLELGVGTGRVLFEICKDGRDGIGIDNEPAMLRQAKMKRRAECPNISGRCRLLKADMLSFDLGRTFGFVYAPSGGVQGDSTEDLRGIFRAGADHLDDDGIFAFDVSSPSSLRQVRSFSPLRVELPGGRVVIRFIAQTWNEADDTTSFDILYKEYLPGTTRTDSFVESATIAVVTPEHVAEALDYAGLSRHELYGDFQRGPYTDESKWMVVAARR
ncbi:MAG: methyltransferase domain-containing protein [Candidatus Eisenbacteria bacterium]|nr:methyltransferase domain-containing protein [Candidatus Eisenbacteria bacterium]